MPGKVARNQVSKSRRARGWRIFGPLEYEWLEDRTLLAGTPISPGAVQALAAGLQALGGAGQRINAQAAILNQPVAVLVQPAAQPDQTTTPATLRTLVPLGDFLSNTLENAAQTALSAPNPTVEGLVSVLAAAIDGHVTGQVSNGVLTIDLSNITFSGEQKLGVDLSGVNRFYSVSNLDPTATPVDLRSDVSIPDLTLNVDLSNNLFYINTPAVVIAQVHGAVSSPFPISLGFLRAQVDGGSADLTSVPSNPAEVQFVDPFGQGIFTTAELADANLPIFTSHGAMSLTAGFTISASLGSFHTDPAQPPTLSLSVPNVFDPGAGLASSQITNFAQIAPFESVEAGQITTLINQIAAAFDRLAQSPALAVALPFINGLTVGGALDPGTPIRTTLFDNLTKTVTDPSTGQTTVVPTFQTAQDLAAQLAKILNVPVSSINPQFNPATNDLTFTVHLITTNPTQNLPFTVSRPDLGVELTTTQDAVSVASSSDLTFTFGATLAPTVAAQIRGQAPLPANGQLTGSAHFALALNSGAPITITVPQSLTADNTNPFDLITDINAALAVAGITGVVANLQTPNPLLAGNVPAPGNGQLAGDAHFALTIDQRPPIRVTVTRASTLNNTSYQDLIDDFNAALQAALKSAGLNANLVSLRAGATSQVISGSLSVPANGQLTGDAHFSLTLPSSAMSPSVTIPVTVLQSATTNNTTPQDLVNDFNQAITAAFQAAGLSVGADAALSTLAPEIIGTEPIPATGRLTGDAHFTLQVNNATPILVTISQAATANNQSAQDLVGDFNAALEAAGLGSIIARFEGANLKFSAIVGAGINTLTLRTTTADPMSTQLGFSATQGSVVTSQLRIESTLASDLRSLILTTTAADPMSTQLGFPPSAVGEQRPVLAFYSPIPQGVRVLKLATSSSDPMVVQLGFANGQQAGADNGFLTLTSADPSSITFLSLTANRTDPAVTELGLDDGQDLPTVQFFARSLTGQTFIQQTSIAGTVSLGAIAGGLQPTGRFGFLGAQSTGGTLSGTAHVAFQLKDPGTTIPGGRLDLFELLAEIGPVKTTGILTKGSKVISGVGSTAGITIGQMVTADGIPANTVVTAIDAAAMTVTLSAAATASSFRSVQPNDPKGTVTPTNLAFSDVLNVVTSPTMTGSASARLPLNFPGFGPSTSVPLGISVSNITDPAGSLSLDTSGMGHYARLQYLNFGNITAAFQSLASYLQAYGSFVDARGQTLLTATLPMINMSPTSLVDYAARLNAFVSALKTLSIDTTQQFQTQATKLLAAYGVNASIVPSLDASGAYSIVVGVTFDPGAEQVRFGLANVPTIVRLGGGAPNLTGVTQFVDNEVSPISFMNVHATAALNLAMGFDLSNPAAPAPFLSDGNRLVTFGVLASGSNLGFPVSFGKVGLFVNGGSGYVNGDGKTNSTTPATITVALTGGNGGRHPLGSHLLTDSTATLNGRAGASLPISLTPTVPPSQPPVGFTITSLGGLLDNLAGSVAPITAPSLKEDYDLIQMIKDTPNLTSGVNKYLLDFQNLLNTQVFKNNYPVVGTQLVQGGQFLEEFRVQLLNQMLNDVQGGNPVYLIQQTLADLFGPGDPEDPGLNWLVDSQGNRATNNAQALADVVVNLSGSLLAKSSSSVNWSMHLNQPQTLVAGPVGLDVGLKALQMNFPLDPSNPAQNAVALNMGFDDFFNFGVNTNDGFYVDITNKQPLKVYVSAAPAAQQYTGTFGYFTITGQPDVVKSQNGNPTEFVGTFTVGVGNSANPSATAVTYQDLLDNSFTIGPKLSATGEVDLSFKTGSFGISAVLDEAWNFSPTDPDLTGGQPQVSLNRIGTAWADAVANFLGPNLKHVFDFLDTGVVGDILDFIEKPLPVISFFLGDTNTIDFLGLLAAAAGNPALYPVVVGFFDTVEFLRSVYSSVPTAFDPRYDLKIDQGSFTITQDLRKLNSLADINTSSLIINNGGVTPFVDQINAYETNTKNKDFTTAEDGGTISGKLTGRLTIGLKNASISLPFFQDPDTVKLMLLGRPGDLLRVVTPSLGVEVQAQIQLPVYSIGPLDLIIYAGGYFDPSIQFGFGYDTTGLTDPHKSLLDGFFFIANQTFLDIQTKIYLGVGAGVPDIASVGFDGFLLWNNLIDLNSPGDDNKVYLNHFGGINDSGSLKLGAELQVKVLFFKKDITIAPTQTLFTYGSPDLPAQSTDPVLANDDSGVLRLNIGPNSGDRIYGDTSDHDATLIVRHVGGTVGNEDVAVDGFGISQVYHGVSKIVADTGQGNDTIDIQPGVLADAELDAGSGNNDISYAGSGTATIQGGTGNNVLKAIGPGTATISADAGNNVFIAGPGTTTFLSNGGNNTFQAGTGTTTLVVGGASSFALSNDRLIAGAFVDRLIGIKNVHLSGSDGDDTFVVSDWSGAATFDGGNGFDTVTVDLGGGGSTTILHSGPIGRARLHVIAANDNEEMNISSNQLTAGADTVSFPSTIESLNIQGGTGNDSFRVLGSPEGSLTIDGGLGDDTFDVINVSRFSRTVFHGGAGNDAVNIAASAAGAFTGASIRGGLVLDGDTGTNRLVADIPGDLMNLLDVEDFAPDTTVRVEGNLTHTLTSNASDLRAVQIGGSLSPLGTVSVHNVQSLSMQGDLAGTVLASGTIGALQVGGNLSGQFSAAAVGALSVGGELTGVVSAGSVNALMVHRSLTGSVAAGSVNAAVIGGDLTGRITVAGRLGRLNVVGATPGKIVAGDVGVVTALAAAGPLVLQVDEASVSRQVLATPTLSGVRFAYVYDSTLPGAPQLSLRVIQGNAAGNRSFDLGLYTHSRATFDLARLDALGQASLRNLVVEGNLHAQSTPQADLYFGLPPGAPGGVWLPFDRLGAIAVRGSADVGSVHAAAIEGLAFASLTAPPGLRSPGLPSSFIRALQKRPLPAIATSASLAQAVLGPGTQVTQADGEFTVPIGKQPVALFLGNRHGVFSPRKLVFAGTRSNQPLTAVVKVARPAGRGSTRIQSIKFLATQSVGSVAHVDAALARY